jgi:hypothetical protein
MPKNETSLHPYVFAGDEAGDTSFRFDRGATTHFTIALIGTRDADSLRLALDKVRARFHLASDFEFKSHGLSHRQIRQALWETLAPLDFTIWAVVVDKQRLADAFRVMPPTAFYAYFTSETIRLIPEDLRLGAPLWLDEFDRSGKTVAVLKRTFAVRGLRYGFKNLRAVRSQSEGLVQVADLAAGAVLRRYSGKASEGYQRLAGKVAAVKRYP